MEIVFQARASEREEGQESSSFWSPEDVEGCEVKSNMSRRVTMDVEVDIWTGEHTCFSSLTYSEQQNCSHVWKFWIVHLIEGKIKCEKLCKYFLIFPIIPPIWQTKNLENRLVASQDTSILWPRSHLNGFVADESTAENCILPVFSIAACGF